VHCRAESPQSIAQGESPVFADKYKIQALKGRNGLNKTVCLQNFIVYSFYSGIYPKYVSLQIFSDH
jgi:hypothetical protein